MYVEKPDKNMTVVSLTPSSFRRNLNFLKKNVVISAITIPIVHEPKTSIIKFKMIRKLVYQ